MHHLNALTCKCELLLSTSIQQHLVKSIQILFTFTLVENGIHGC